jgi:hypothetical protein
VAARAGRAMSWYFMLTVVCNCVSGVERGLDRKTVGSTATVGVDDDE